MTQRVKFYQTGTLTVGNRLLDEENRTVQSTPERNNSLTSGHRACQGCGEALGARYVVDVAMRKVLDYILVGKRAWGLALTRDEKTLYVANGLSDDISIVDTASRRVLKSVPVGRVPYGILIDD